MGLFGAMTASVAGLGAQGQAISVISDNLANTNTIGYKASRSLFSQMVTSSGVSGTAYNSGGVSAAVQRDQAAQGSFITGTSSTDLAISGNGFFKVADSQQNGTSTTFYYTRAGSFAEDKEGYLTNPQGLYLQGWKTDSDGTILNIQNPQAIELQSVGVSSLPSTEASIDANLNSAETVNPLYATSTSIQDALSKVLADPTKADYVADIRVYDAQGGARDMTVQFTKRSPNTWDWQLVTDGSNIQGGTAGQNTSVATGTLEFNTNGGSLKNATVSTGGTGSPMEVKIPWANGVDASEIKLDFGDYTGGKEVTATSTGLGLPSTPGTHTATAGTITNVTAMTTDGTEPNGTYTVKRADANTLELIGPDGTTVVGTAAITNAPTGASETYNFTNAGVPTGVSITTGAAFDNSAVADGASFGTITLASTPGIGGVLGITAENLNLPDGTYTLVNTGPGTFSLTTSLGTESVTIGASGTREMYFKNSGVRITVDDSFDENPGVGAVGTFTVASTGPENKGIGTDGITQLAASYNTTATNQNGFGAGTLSSIAVDKDGFVNGTFTNGQTKKLYKVALAVFQDPGGLEVVSGTLLRPTDASGEALLKEPGVGGTGTIVGGNLEGSTTDIAGEFSNMIVAQRAFQASSKVITTVDQMLNDLLSLR